MTVLDPLKLAVLALVIARITRFITSDTLFKPSREWMMTLEARWKKGRVGPVSLTTLLNCHWCAGIWVSAGVVGLSWACGDAVWLWMIWAWLALAQVGAMVNEREERVE